MCWSLEVSLVACLWGYGVSIFLRQRKHSARDPWYALFLATFTTTQAMDAFFWYLKGESGDIPCTTSNFVISNYLVPPVVFFQPIVLMLFPSDANIWMRNAYAVITVLLMLIPVLYSHYGCSTIWIPTGIVKYPTILYGGVLPPLWVVTGGIGWWAVGAALFVRPWQASAMILAVGTVVLTLLTFLDGTLVLISKMCTYCLILSFAWLLEPLWIPSTPPTPEEFVPGQYPDPVPPVAGDVAIPMATIVSTVAVPVSDPASTSYVRLQTDKDF